MWMQLLWNLFCQKNILKKRFKLLLVRIQKTRAMQCNGLKCLIKFCKNIEIDFFIFIKTPQDENIVLQLICLTKCRNYLPEKIQYSNFLVALC